MAQINNLEYDQVKEIAELNCDEEYGCDGHGSHPGCGNCIVCDCRKIMEAGNRNE